VKQQGGCSQDLAHEFDDAAWNRWWEYCPVQIGAVHVTTRTPHKIPHSIGLRLHN